MSEYTTINAENERLIGRSFTDLERAAQDEWMAEMGRSGRLNHFQVNDRVVQHRPRRWSSRNNSALAVGPGTDQGHLFRAEWCCPSPGSAAEPRRSNR